MDSNLCEAFMLSNSTNSPRLIQDRILADILNPTCRITLFYYILQTQQKLNSTLNNWITLYILLMLVIFTLSMLVIFTLSMLQLSVHSRVLFQLPFAICRLILTY